MIQGAVKKGKVYGARGKGKNKGKSNLEGAREMGAKVRWVNAKQRRQLKLQRSST